MLFTMNTLSIKVSPWLDRALTEASARQGLRKSEWVRRAITAYLGPAGAEQASLLSAMVSADDLVGYFGGGPANLSSNPRHSDGSDTTQADLLNSAPAPPRTTPKTSPPTPPHKRFDKIETRIDDGVLRVEGIKRVARHADGLGGSFTYCTLGEAVDLEKLLSGERLPAFEALGAWLLYTATGATLPAAPAQAPPHYLGETPDRHVWMIYRPELHFLKSPDAALTLTVAKAFQAWGHAHDAQRDQPLKGHLVFAPAKYLSNQQLKDHGIDHAPLPFALYRES